MAATRRDERGWRGCGGRLRLRLRRDLRALHRLLRRPPAVPLGRYRVLRVRDPSRDRGRHADLRFPSGRRALQVRPRCDGSLAPPSRGNSLVTRRIAMVSVHACPLAKLGGRDSGGMNVYVRELARDLGTRGVEVDVFTRWREKDDPRIQSGPIGYWPKMEVYEHL